MSMEKIILGIDPGTINMGYGIIATHHKDIELICLGTIELGKIADHYVRMQTIFIRITSLIDEFHPDELSIEAPFYSKNVQSMLKLGRAQGVAIAAALSRSLPIFEYAPRKIKLSITGQGNASKEQVARLLQQILHLEKLPDNLDATDGLAAAMCHFYQQNAVQKNKSYKNWEDYMRKNPQRIK